MANPAVLESILNKLIRINAQLGSAAGLSLAADVVALQTTVGDGTNVSISADIADIQTVLNAVGA